MKTLRQWKTEATWFAVLCTLFAMLAVAKPAYSEDEERWYSRVDNWCWQLEPYNCLWQK